MFISGIFLVADGLADQKLQFNQAFFTQLKLHERHGVEVGYGKDKTKKAFLFLNECISGILRRVNSG
jgi:hypothetical protein